MITQMITQRQGEILNRIVQEYIDSVKPVSSQLLEKRAKFGICPATIRNEMQKLTDKGYLRQPHTSAGRVPTDKGYRFFVDGLLEKQPAGYEEMEDWFEQEIQDEIRFVQSLTKNLAVRSQALVLGYLGSEKVFWKEGWGEVLREPEFEEKGCLIKFTEFLANFEENIESFKVNSEIKIYIGRENPFKKVKDFSIISSRCRLPDNEETIISLLGPTRMDYNRNIGLINSLTKLLSNF